MSRGDKVLVLESGLFAIGWGEMASTSSASMWRFFPATYAAPLIRQPLSRRLREDTAGEIKAIMVVQIDTASGVVNDIPENSSAAIDAAGHGALFMVDAIASLATMPFEMDDWGIDVAVTGSQKGLMTPPGLSYVAANARAHGTRHETADMVTRYWDWTFRQW